MQFLIANTFQTALTQLTAQEQKVVKTTVFDLQINPAQPSLKMHKLEQAKDPNFWSLRASSELRVILHKTAASLLICYVDHHDAAYSWAMRRTIQQHPTTGAAQIVEVRELVTEITVSSAVPQPAAAPLAAVLTTVSDETLLSYGVPTEWLTAVQQATDDTIFDILPHLPEEAAEAVLALATGSTPPVPAPLPADATPFTHPDAQRRFRVLTNVAELERALEYPWDQWTVFLHPAQRQLVERTYSGPARVAGSAGTGKTVVALHRAVTLARQQPSARVLLATFSKALANALNRSVQRLVGNEPSIRDRIHIYDLQEVGTDLYTEAFGPPQLATPVQVEALLVATAAATSGAHVSKHFLLEEWYDIVDAWQLASWAAYRDVPRLGRKTRLGAKQREALWTIFASVQAQLAADGLITWPQLYGRVSTQLAASATRPFDAAVVDEAQDLSVPELRFLAAVVTQHENGLFFAGDLGQRIFQAPFSWKQIGVDIRGRSHTLTINYRTSHQIRQQADRLLPGAIADVDGTIETRKGTISVFNGPAPTITVCPSRADEEATAAAWLGARLAAGLQPDEIGVVVRSAAELPRALAAVGAAGATATVLDDHVAPAAGCVAVSTMHLAKGLEFRAVAVLACDDDVLPLHARIATAADEADLDEVYTTERHLLYVACTRARDHLLVTGVAPASEFLDDLR